jgi:hypothetical protein
MSFMTFNCRTCGAGIDVQPDNLLTVCEYCGSIYPAKDIGDVPVHIVPSRPRDEITAAVKKRMESDRQMRGVPYTIESVEGVYVPLYVNYVHVTGYWQGYRKEKKNKKTVKVFKSGRMDQQGDFPVPARKHAHEFGLSRIGSAIFEQKPVPFRDLEWKSAALPVLSVDMDENETDAMIRDNLLDLIAERIRKQHRLDAVTEFTASTRVENRFILLYPLWTVIYLCRGGSYRLAVEGGEPSVVAAMEPVFLHQRARRFLIALAMTIAIGLIWYVAWWFLFEVEHDEDSDVGGLGLLAAAGMVGAFLLAWRMVRKMVASVNVEGVKKKKEWSPFRSWLK